MGATSKLLPHEQGSLTIIQNAPLELLDAFSKGSLESRPEASQGLSSGSPAPPLPEHPGLSPWMGTVISKKAKARQGGQVWCGKP